MPGWHEKTRAAQSRGRLRLVGIIPEQHPDRTRLFMQWKEMSWPVLVDPLNLLEVTAVPLTYLVDEHGIIRYSRPSDEDLETFLSTAYPEPPPSASPDAARPDAEAVSLALWGGDAALDRAVEAYQARLADAPGSGADHFRIGVVYRQRYDSPRRREGDFRRAVEHWRTALELDPNQYIWRRRIQQYGPRLNKPYPFYDWVEEARREIAARGETPVPLAVEPGGAELAEPVEALVSDGGPRREPDPEGRILRDEKRFVLVETVAVPSTAAPDAGRIHVELRPNAGIQAHWNNEVGELEFWVEPPPGWRVDRQYWNAPLPPQPVSQELRRIEFEWKAPPGLAGKGSFRAYALYYVCEDVDGTCLYRRQDIPIEVELTSP